jgi:putative NADH-flavin reductase
MKLLVLGATGRTGRHLVAKAMARGHAVTAMVRDPAALGPQPGLAVVKGDARSVADLSSALAGHDAVVSVLGHRSKADATLLRDNAAALQLALRQQGVRRYLVVSQALLFPSKNPIVALLRWLLSTTVADSTAMEQVVSACEVDWTLVRPPRLTDGGPARGYRVGLGAMPAGAWSMQRADLAEFLLDEAQSGKHPRAVLGLGAR